MSRSIKPLNLTDDEKLTIEALIRSPQSTQGQVTRLKIVNFSHQGLAQTEIARTLGIGLSASFPSKTDLRNAIEAFIQATNHHPRPFVWRKREVKGAQLRNTIVNLCN